MTLYFVQTADNDWFNLGNWFEDTDATIPAAGIPSVSDDAIIQNGEVTTNASSDYSTLVVAINGVLTENESSKIVFSNAGTITTNNGNLVTNTGTISTNGGGGSINVNNGIITLNNGTVTSNTANIGTNNATVETNTGTVTSNAGIVVTNNGTVGFSGSIQGGTGIVIASFTGAMNLANQTAGASVTFPAINWW